VEDYGLPVCLGMLELLCVVWFLEGCDPSGQVCFSLGLFVVLAFCCRFRLGCDLVVLLLLLFSSWCRRIFVGGPIFLACW